MIIPVIARLVAFGDERQGETAWSLREREQSTSGKLERAPRFEPGDVAGADRLVGIGHRARYVHVLHVADNDISAAVQPTRRRGVDSLGQVLAIDLEFSHLQDTSSVGAVGQHLRPGSQRQAVNRFAEPIQVQAGVPFVGTQ